MSTIRKCSRCPMKVAHNPMGDADPHRYAGQPCDPGGPRPRRASSKPKIKVGDTVNIGKLIEWGVVQDYAGKTAVILRRTGCPAGFALCDVLGVGQRYIATKRMQPVEVKS